MSDNDAEPIPAVAPDTKIENALRNVVRNLWLAGDHENLTLRRVRKSVEHQLGLPEDFLRSDRAWKARSEKIVTNQVSVQEQASGQIASAEHETPLSQASARSQKRKSSSKEAGRALPVDSGAREHREARVASADEAFYSDVASSPQPTSKRPAKTPRVVQDLSDGDDGDENDEPITAAPHPSSGEEAERLPVQANPGNRASRREDESVDSHVEPEVPHSDSDMSILIDEPPRKKKKKQEHVKATSSRSSRPANGKTKPKGRKDVSPHDAEIKRLQGWLIKCGIRKLWGKELKPFTTSKAKINHLKEMLRAAGMEGRYSIEKARQIKERRELAADLEAVQEGAKRWGQADSDGGGGVRPRRLAKGLKDLEGLVESEDEESE